MDTGVTRLSQLHMHSFLAADDENTPVNIANLRELDHLEGRRFAVVQISYGIDTGKRELAEMSRPRPGALLRKSMQAEENRPSFQILSLSQL